MSYLDSVSDFFVNPVLKQARRFSRSSSRDSAGAANIEAPFEAQRNNDGIVGLSEQPHGTIWQEMDGSSSADAALPAQLSTTAVEEDNALGAARIRPAGAAAATDTPHVVPLRLPSLSSDYDGYVSDNPSFSSRIQMSSPSPTSLSSRRYGLNHSGRRPTEGASSQPDQNMSALGTAFRRINSSIPADDGMGVLRQRIMLIQDLDISGEQKARMMHQLMTERYNQGQESANTKQHIQPPSPSTLVSQERPTTSGSLSSFIWQINGMDLLAEKGKQTFHLSPEDLKRTYAPLDTEAEENIEGVSTEAQPIPSLGCCHYKRNVKLQCSTCDRWYTCRLCHDEVEDHVLVRKATQNMLCMICGCAQKAGESCVECGERTAWYYCDICKLWDDDANKNIYHCNDCGICRKGRGLGKDFFHCKTCGTCMSMAVEKSHKCIERVSDCDCPICGEYMFTSPLPVVFMLCGHSIHYACYNEHMKSSYKCPICSKSTVNMETQFRNLDRAIDSQPMPPQFQDTKAMVLCNDCHAKSAVKYHWLGLKCAICDSYNTAQLSILSDPAVEMPVVENRDIETSAVLSEVTAAESIIRPGTDSPRSRRHSLHTYAAISSLAPTGSSSSAFPQRLGRSVSPPRGPGFLDTPVPLGDSDESGEEDELDFWGIEELRSVTSAENIENELEADDEYEDDSASALDDCDGSDDEAEEDEFTLVGHR